MCMGINQKINEDNLRDYAYSVISATPFYKISTDIHEKSLYPKQLNLTLHAYVLQNIALLGYCVELIIMDNICKNTLIL